MRIVQLVVIPIAPPAWELENVLRRLGGSTWEFKMFWSGTIYILCIFTAGSYLVLGGHPAVRVIGFYILLALQVLALAIVAVVPVGTRAGYSGLLHQLARRRQSRGQSLTSTTSINTVYAAILCYGYTIYFLGAAGYLVEIGDLGAFSAAPTEPGVSALSDFVYSSFVWMVTLGFAEVVPSTALAKIVCATAFAMGLLFNLLIFSLFVARLTDVRRTS